ncbi:MAG: sulfatase [Armatimonadetes bacterium]|nr:sulfatase [Armatimonadota bacterium]
MNVVVVVSDTCRRDRIGAYGTEWMVTPSLDWLAARSMVFNRAYCASFPTVPHRVDCLTGRYGFPFYGWEPLPEQFTSLPEVLEKQGVATQLIHDTPGMHGANCGRGFRGVKFNQGQATSRPELIRVEDEVELPCDADRIRSPESMLARLRDSTWWEDESDSFAARTFMDGCAWLAENQGAEGFLLWVDTFDPHEPWLSPEWYVRMYYPDYEGQDFIQAPYDYLDDKFTDEEIMWMHARYCAELTMMDRWLGEFLDTFFDLGFDEDTALIFTSDHGFYLGEHNRAGKHTLVGDPWPLYEEDSGVPLMIHLPDGPRGVYSDALVQAPDLRPTILDLLEVEPTGEEHGKSLLPLLAGDDEPLREYAFSSGYIDEDRGQLKTRVAVNSADGWALHFHRDYEPELYYLPDDPAQENNIVAGNEDQADRLHGAFVEFLREVGASENVQDICRTWRKAN